MSNKQEPAKEYTPLEICESYYWFVTHINPHLFYYEKNSFPYTSFFPSDTRPLLTFNKLDCHDSVPECVHEAIEQLIREWRGCGNISKELVFDETGKAVWLVCEHDLYEYVLGWLMDNGIRDNDLFLYTPSGSPIYSIKHIKALWSELEIKPRTLLDGKPACMPYLIDNIDIIKNHLTPQYTDNLKKLSQAEARKEEERKAEGTPTKNLYTTTELLKILEKETNKPISPSYFTKIKSEVKDFPEPKNTEKYPHLWKHEDIPKIIECTKRFFEQHPKILPVRTPTKTKKSKKKAPH